MRLYFLRHGLAGDREDWHGDDNERPLTPEGVAKMEREAKTIAKLGLELDAIVTSPLARAVQTARIVADELDLRDILVEDENLGLDFDLARLRNVVEKHRAAEALMLVGHEPSMSRTIGQIGGGRIELKKGALACIDLDPNSMRGELLSLVPPKILVLKT
ncbi:MAG: SixA phosphatase family protein [Vulcanimicrobiaceae bacterium]